MSQREREGEVRRGELKRLVDTVRYGWVEDVLNPPEPHEVLIGHIYLGHLSQPRRRGARGLLRAIHRRWLPLVITYDGHKV